MSGPAGGLQALGWVARRSVVRTARRPEAVTPAFLFPLILLTLTSAGMRSFARAPEFPADSYFDFALAGAVVQAALVGAVTSGANLANDVESGFLARMALTPVPRRVLLAGHLAGSAALAATIGALYLVVGAVLGVDFHTGLAGAAAVVGMAALVSLGFSALCATLALRTGSSEAIQGMFPLFFTLLSISTFFAPRALIPGGWFRRVATANPVSHLIDGMRGLVIAGWDAGELSRAAALAAGLALLAALAALVALERRLEAP